MICADVQTLARAAPEPATAPKVNLGDVGNSFDQFFQEATSDRPTDSKASVSTRSTEREKPAVDDQTEKDESVDRKPKNDGRVAENSADKRADKPVKENKTEDTPIDQEKEEPAQAEEDIQQAALAAMAMQVAAAVVPVQQTDTADVKSETAESPVAQAAVPVMQNAQSTVIQLPETDPQPLPDELKQAVQQPKVEVKDFKALVENAAQNLENQAAVSDPQAESVATTTQVAKPLELQKLDTQEPAVKVADLSMQADDLAAIDTGKNIANAYALTSAKSTENLVQPKSLPIIQKVSTEVAELVREQGQSMRIQIHPENLGKIDLRLVSNSDGMKVVMTAEVPATARLLETHLDQLQQSLSNAGVSISGMSVNSQGAQGQPNNATPGQPAQGQQHSTLTNFQADADAPSPLTIQLGSSSLDYRV